MSEFDDYIYKIRIVQKHYVKCPCGGDITKVNDVPGLNASICHQCSTMYVVKEDVKKRPLVYRE